MLAREYLEPPAQRFTRWTGAAGMVVAFHVTAAVLALLFWPREEAQDEQRPGAIMIELPALAAESPSDQLDLAEQPQFEKSAPPPSPADDVQETPPEDRSPSEATPVEEPAPEKVAAAESQSVADPIPDARPAETPPVEEAPLAPEPAVTLPKEAPPEISETKPDKAEEKTTEKAEKSPNSKPAPKSESQQQRQAAAAAKGRFDPNPVYRAKPAYPPGARASKTEGYVVVSYSVSASGAVSNVRVVSASPPGVFNGVTVSAVQQWRFKPSAQGAQGRRTTIRFKLR